MTNAFKMPGCELPSAEDMEFLRRLAAVLKRRGLAEPALFALDSTRPLHGTGAQALHFLAPLLEVVADTEESGRFARLLGNPRAMDRFHELLER